MTAPAPDHSLTLKRLTVAALCLALAMVLPLLTAQIRLIGKMLCPMHIPVILCGFICGWKYGLGIGLVVPFLRLLIFGMPVLYPGAIAMSIELAAYGAIAGLLYRILPKTEWAIYVSLLVAMIAGRVLWGIAQVVLLSLQGSAFTLEAFIAGAFAEALPGIILQIVLIPLLVSTLRKATPLLNA